jgi:hypothetical protein
MQEADTYLAILEEREEKTVRKNIVVFGKKRSGASSESIKG